MFLLVLRNPDLVLSDSGGGGRKNYGFLAPENPSSAPRAARRVGHGDVKNRTWAMLLSKSDSAHQTADQAIGPGFCVALTSSR